MVMAAVHKQRLLPFLVLVAPVLAAAFTIQPASLHDGLRLPLPSSITPKAKSSIRQPRPLHASSSPLGDLFSGITGVAPSSLSPPPELLAGTSIDPARDDVDLGRVYKATKDGWSAINFHNCVDGKGSAIVVALSKSGKRFGGFNPLGWMSTDDYGNSISAFLWFESGGKPVKCPILAGGNTAIYDYATAGPTFGAADLQIGPPKAAVMGGFAGPDMEDSSRVAGSLKRGKSSVGGCYDYVKGWPVSGQFGLAEVEVYVNLNVGKRTAYRGGGGLFGGF